MILYTFSKISVVMNRQILKILKKNRSIVISGSGWSFRTFYALYHGFLFITNDRKLLDELTSSTIVNFIIEDKKSEKKYITGKGRVEILGSPLNYKVERGILLFKVPEYTSLLNDDNSIIVKIVPEGDVQFYDLSEGYRVITDLVDINVLKEDINPMKKYFYALRPWSLQMSVADIVLGALISPYFNILKLILSAIAVVLLQAGANLLNSFFDFRSGVDKPINVAPSSSRVLVDNLIPLRYYMLYMFLVMGTGISLGAYLILLYPRVLIIGVLGIIAALTYSIPKYGLKWLALGDLAVFLIWGPGIVLGSYILQGGSLSPGPLFLSTGLGLIVTAVLHSNNWRDIKSDSAQGVKTIAYFLGQRGSMIYYLALIWSSFVFIGISVIYDAKLLPLLGSFLTMPWAIKLTKIALDEKNWKRMILDALTAQFQSLHMYFSLIFLIGYIIVLHLIFH